MERFNRWSFAMGIAFCMAVAGCMMAVSDAGNANTGWRYELVSELSSGSAASGSLVVFDRQTGTSNIFRIQSQTVEVYKFSAE